MKWNLYEGARIFESDFEDVYASSQLLCGLRYLYFS